MKNFTKLILFFLLSIGPSAQGLVPIEGIIYGDVQDIKQDDPFKGMLTSKYFEIDGDDKQYEKMIYYLALYKQGVNLKNSCEGLNEVSYNAFWKEDSAKRSVVAQLQYLGLDLSLRAIVNYAKVLDYNKTKFLTLTKNLVRNGCSPNISVYSKKYLNANFNYYWDHDTSFSLPSLAQNDYFPTELKKAHNTLETKKREFEYSVRNFQALCSWNLDTDDLGGLTEYLKNPFLMAYLINNFVQKEIGIDEKTEELFVKRSDKGVQVLCENMICRKTDRVTFNKKFPRMNGSQLIEDDLKLLYCSHFSKLRSKKNNKTLYSHNAEASHLVALITGIPEVNLISDKFKDSFVFMKDNIKQRWDKWAKAQSDKMISEQLYEETLELSLREQANSYEVEIGEFNLKFDVELGEFDKVLRSEDKLTASFNLEFPVSYIEYMRERVPFLYNNDRLTALKNIEARFIEMISYQLDKKKDYFEVPLWNDQLAAIIAQELTQQFVKARLYKRTVAEGQSFVKIPVKFYFGAFALQYIRKKYIFRNNFSEKLSFN
tara:strand:- start:3376 stop:5004 length:1629 start_codon:yes stop_codon:yes gene_type:complete